MAFGCSSPLELAKKIIAGFTPNDLIEKLIIVEPKKSKKGKKGGKGKKGKKGKGKGGGGGGNADIGICLNNKYYENIVNNLLMHGCNV